MAEITVTKDNFDSEVMASKIPVLLDFWAPWCGPCRMIAPVVAEIAEENEGKLLVGKVNVDDEEELARAFAVRSIPFLVVIKDGKVVNSAVGAMPKEDILALTR